MPPPTCGRLREERMPERQSAHASCLFNCRLHRNVLQHVTAHAKVFEFAIAQRAQFAQRASVNSVPCMRDGCLLQSMRTPRQQPFERAR